MRFEPGAPAASPPSSHTGAKESAGEIGTPTSSVQTETQLSTSPTAANQTSGIARDSLPSENRDGRTESGMTGDPAYLLSLFHPESKADDTMQEAGVHVIPVDLKTATNETAAPSDSSEPIQQAAAEINHSVGEAAAFKMELDELREFAKRLAQQNSKIEDALHATEQRGATTLQVVNALEARLGLLAAALQGLIGSPNVARLTALNEPREQAARKVELLGDPEDKVEYGLIPPRKTPRLMWSYGAVIGGLGLLVLAIFSLTSLVEDEDLLGGRSAAIHAQPILANSAFLSPEMMLTAVLPNSPQTRLSTGEPSMLTAKMTTTQDPPRVQAFPERQPPLEPQSPVDLQSPQISMRGTLEVQSDPTGAAVFVNRQRVGQTPLQWPQLRAGSYLIWIEREGYQRWIAAVRVEADTVTRIDGKLQPEPVRPGIQ